MFYDVLIILCFPDIDGLQQSYFYTQGLESYIIILRDILLCVLPWYNFALCPQAV